MPSPTDKTETRAPTPMTIPSVERMVRNGFARSVSNPTDIDIARIGFIMGVTTLRSPRQLQKGGLCEKTLWSDWSDRWRLRRLVRWGCRGRHDGIQPQHGRNGRGYVHRLSRGSELRMMWRWLQPVVGIAAVIVPAAARAQR